MSKRATSTNLIELAETHNIMLALNRLCDNSWNQGRWKRAFYHALSMSNAAGDKVLEKVRVALELP